MEEKIEKFKELMKAKHNCQFCLDHVTGNAVLGRKSRKIETGGSRDALAKQACQEWRASS